MKIRKCQALLSSSPEGGFVDQVVLHDAGIHADDPVALELLDLLVAAASSSYLVTSLLLVAGDLQTRVLTQQSDTFRQARNG